MNFVERILKKFQAIQFTDKCTDSAWVKSNNFSHYSFMVGGWTFVVYPYAGYTSCGYYSTPKYRLRIQNGLDAISKVEDIDQQTYNKFKEIGDKALNRAKEEENARKMQALESHLSEFLNGF